MNRLQLLFYFGLFTFITACGELPKSNSITVAGLVFQNRTATPVYNAKLSVSKTHGLISCGVILPGKECSTTFPVRQYQGNPISVSWEQAGQAWSSGEFYVQLPRVPLADSPTIAVVTLGEHGSVNARLEPQPSARSVPKELQPELR